MTDKKIIKVKHRHDGQTLVVEVGQASPSHYQRPGRIVVRIDDTPVPNPLRCVLDDGQIILIGRGGDTEVTYA